MKNLIFLIFIALSLNATEYFSTIEPYEKHTISSEADGRVVLVNKTKEYSFINQNETILKLDIKDESIVLNTLQNSLVLQKDIVNIKESNYKNKFKVRQLSLYDKNQEKLYLIEAKQTLENMKRDIKNEQNKILKKVFNVKDKYLGEIYVSTDEYVTSGTKLYTLYDFSKFKLEVFIRNQDINTIKGKAIFIDDKKTDFVIEKISHVRDEKRVSTYKVILSKVNTKTNTYFGKVVKVEFR